MLALVERLAKHLAREPSKLRSDDWVLAISIISVLAWFLELEARRLVALTIRIWLFTGCLGVE